MGNTLVAITKGRVSTSLPAPDRFLARSGGYTRLVLRNLPLPIPVTDAVANTVHRDAVGSDGVLITTGAAAVWNFDLTLPTADAALIQWASSHGLSATYSQAGRYAQALLSRLGQLSELGALADRSVVAILGALAPQSRKKLAQRLVKEGNESGAALDEDSVARRLTEIGLFLETTARSLGDVASLAGVDRRPALAAITKLVGAGLVARGRVTRCPQCRGTAFFGLDELAETLLCRYCRYGYLLEVTDEDGDIEASLHYRLDGLMARAMDQDLLPPLLTLNKTLPPAEQRELFFAWPGVEFASPELHVEVDLLTFDGTMVTAFECKTNAENLKAEQLSRLLAFCERVGAVPGVAAMDGTFADDVLTLVRERGGDSLRLLPE